MAATAQRPLAGTSDYPPSPSTSRVAPRVRSAADYNSDSEDDELDGPTLRDSLSSDEDELVYAAGAKASNGKGKHRARPSAAGLLSQRNSEDEFGIPGPTRQARQDRLEEYDEALASGWAPLREVRRRWRAFRAFVARNEGFLLIAGSQSFFASISCLVKLLEAETQIAIWELILVRMSFTWLGCYSYMRYAGVEYPLSGPPGIRMLLVARGVIGFGGLFGSYYSLQYMSLSDATVLGFMSPILVGVLATVLLKEPYSKSQTLAGLASLGGTILVAKPTFLFGGADTGETTGPDDRPVTSEERLLAVAAAMFGVVSSAGAYLTIRKIGTRANALHSISFFAIYCCIVSIGYAIATGSKPVFYWSWGFWLKLLPIGVLGFCAQALLTTGLQREKAGRGTLAVYTNLIFALILEYAVFDKLPDFFSILGSSIIIGGAVKVALEKKTVVTSPGAGTGHTVQPDLNEDVRDRKKDRENLAEEGKAISVDALPSTSGVGER